ncbi:MAG: hypothetical protein LBH45_07150 [Campylobacteraceae bacterium]|jgi:hypothetical protein|nr:hypothetical protein [Campylobacteraceae bacterium]
MSEKKARKKYIHSLSQQFRDRCLNMRAWAEKHDVSHAILLQIAAKKRNGIINTKAKEIIQLLEEQGFTVETRQKAA